MNQCDGCRLGLPLENGNHIHPEKDGWGRIHMGCTAAKYEGQEQPEAGTVNYVAEVRPNPGNAAEVMCSICGAVLVCLACGNHRDERIARLEQHVKELEAERDTLRATVERLSKPVTIADLKRRGVQVLCATSAVHSVNALLAARAKDGQ